MSIGLNCLLESPHFLNFEDLSVPLYFNLLPLFSLDSQLFGQFLLLLLEISEFFLKLLDTLVCNLI